MDMILNFFGDIVQFAVCNIIWAIIIMIAVFFMDVRRSSSGKDRR
jgi:hypothetical protein